VDERHRVDWRDPRVLELDGRLHGVIAARANRGAANRRGCAGYIVSQDGETWEVRPPLCCPGVSYDFETPALAELQGRFYLTGICGKRREGRAPCIVRVADQVEGPYRRIGHDELLPADNQVFKPCRWGGKTLYFHNLWGRADWPGGGDHIVSSIAPPKVADVDDEGALVLRPYTDWSSLTHGPTVILSGDDLATAGTAMSGEWAVLDADFCGTSAAGVAMFLLDSPMANVVVDAELTVADGGEVGIFLRASADSDDATFVSLAPVLRRVQLYTLQANYKTPSAGVTYRWRGQRLVQEWHCPFAWDGVLRLRVVDFGPYCEVSVNDRVVISALTMARDGGQLGFFAEDTALTVRRVTLQPLAEWRG
jgi:hypothetical protein